MVVTGTLSPLELRYRWRTSERELPTATAVSATTHSATVLSRSGMPAGEPTVVTAHGGLGSPARRSRALLRGWRVLPNEREEDLSTARLAALGRRVFRHPVAPVAVLGVLMLATGASLLSLQRGMTFLVDEWNVLAERRSWDHDTLLLPFYEHLFVVPVLVFKLLMSTIGIGPHWAYVIPLVALHLACVTLIYVLARSRIGAWFALAPAVLILFLGSSYDNMLLPIQVSFLGSMAAGLAVLVAFDSPPSRRRDLAASIFLGLSLACSSVGLVFVIAALVEIVSRQGWRSRIWIVAAPSFLYGCWYIIYGARGLQQGGSIQANVPSVPRHVADAAAAVFGAITGLGLEWGRIFAILALVALVVVLLRDARLSPRSLALLAGLTAFWALGGLARAHQDDAAEASRYLYPGAVLVVLLTVEAMRSVRLDRRWAILLSAAVLFVAVGNADALRGARDTHLVFSREVSAQFAAFESLGRSNVDPESVPAIYLAPQIDAGTYFDMADALGSPVDVRRDLLQGGEVAGGIADTALAAALADNPQTGPSTDAGKTPPIVDKTAFGVARETGACVRFEALDVGATVSFRLREAGILIRAGSSPVLLSVKRFGDTYKPVATVPAKSSIGFRVPSGSLPSPWHLSARSRGSVTACSVEFAAPR